MIYNVNKAISTWIIDKLQNTIDLYLGTSSTKGEVLVRDIGIYEKNTFRRLLDYHAYKLLRERDVELQRFGRLHVSDSDITDIIKLVNVFVNSWVQTWVQFTKKHPDIRISDLTAKRSKVLLWFDMSIKTWTESKIIINDSLQQLKIKYSGYCIYPLFYEGEKEALEMQWPNLKFISMEDIRAELLELLKGKLSQDIDTTMISYYIGHVTDNLYDVADTTPEDESIISKHKDIIKQKKQDFINYVTQQVFGDKGYLYGGLRENVADAISKKEQPSVVDFTNLMLTRALTESYGNLNLSDDNYHVYDRNDLDEVIANNKKFVFEVVVPEYAQRLLDNNIMDSGIETSSAFGFDIPSEAVISEIDDSLTEKVVETLDKIGSSVYDTFSTDDLADWYKTLKDHSNKITEEKHVDKSFIEPVTDAATNALGVATKRLVTAKPINEVKSIYKDNPTTRSENRISNWNRYYPGATDGSQMYVDRTSDWTRYYPGESTETERVAGWKRYYPNNTTETERVTGWTRYYPHNATEVDRVTDWSRYYPYIASENDRVSNWQRYYPSNTSTDTRVSNWKRYYAGEGKVASDFVPTYRTFSGHDMVVTVQVPLSNSQSITKIVGAFQTISYSIHNEKSPIRVLGDMNVRRFVFGPRMIAGSIVLTVFDRHWMRELMESYVKIKSETERYFLMDELPALNITISCVNEYGHNAKLALYGVTIVNEGQIMSINDIYTENTYEFFALNVDYLDKVEVTIANKKSSAVILPVGSLKGDGIPGDSNEKGNDNDNESISGKPAGSIIEPVNRLDPAILKAPDVITAYVSESQQDYDDEYNIIVDNYTDGKISYNKAVSQVNSNGDKEKKARLKQWEDDIYNPKYEAMLSHFKVNKSEVKDTAKLKNKLGDNYTTFILTLSSYEQAYNHMKQLIWETVAGKCNNIREQQLATVAIAGGISSVIVTDSDSLVLSVTNTVPTVLSSAAYWDGDVGYVEMKDVISQ